MSGWSSRGEIFLTAAERAEFNDALPAGVAPRFITLSVAFDLALRRVSRDETRGVSRDPLYLREHYDVIAQAVREVPSRDLKLDTGAIGIDEAARVIADWASRQVREPSLRHRSGMSPSEK